MPDHQRILVVSTGAEEAELARVRGKLGRDPVLITAPTGEAKRVVGVLGVEPQVELLLAPVRFPGADRGHQLDALVRRHAVRDRFRDVVVVTDAATSTLLLRTLAPDQLPTGGAVTVVGLARGDRPVDVRRGVVAGLALGVPVYLADTSVPVFVLPGVAALAGCGLLLLARWRHLGQELLLAAAVALTTAIVIAAGSARFLDGW